MDPLRLFIHFFTMINCAVIMKLPYFLFDAFGKVRLAETWNKDLSRIRKWLKGNDGED